MGNRQKSQRKMFYEHQQKKLLSTIREASKQVKPPPSRSTQLLSDFSQPNESPQNQQQPQQRQHQQSQQQKKSSDLEDAQADFTAILDEECLYGNLKDIEDSILSRIEEGSICVIDPAEFDENNQRIPSLPSHRNKSHKSNSSNDSEDIRLVWRAQCSTHHFPQYERVVISLLDSYNKQMQVEQISKKQWESFCADLEEHSFLPKHKKPTATNAKANTATTISNHPTVSATTTSQPFSSPYNFLPNTNNNSTKINNLSNSAEDTQSQADEQQIRQEIRRFRSFLIASNETFQLFRVVSSELNAAFARIYGETQLPERLASASAWTLEKHIEIDLIYIVSVFELLLSKMSEFYSTRRITQSIGNNQAPANTSSNIISGSESMLQSSPSLIPSGSMELRTSFLSAMQGETTTLPIVNMLFVLMRKTFDRIRSMIAPHALPKKVFSLLSKRSSKEFISKESQTLSHLDAPYAQSIALLQRLQSSFRKNPVSAVKALKTLFKPTIIHEIEDAAATLKIKSALQQSSLMHSTGVTAVAPTLPIRSEFLLSGTNSKNNNKLNDIRLTHHAESTEVSSQQSDKGTQDILKVKRYFSASADGSEGARENKITNLVGQGAEEMLPIYSYIIAQAEARMTESLFLDLKIFNMIFSELQEKVPSFTEHILNATNLLQAYFNLRDLYKEKLLLREKKAATTSQ